MAVGQRPACRAPAVAAQAGSRGLGRLAVWVAAALLLGCQPMPEDTPRRTLADLTAEEIPPLGPLVATTSEEGALPPERLLAEIDPDAIDNEAVTAAFRLHLNAARELVGNGPLAVGRSATRVARKVAKQSAAHRQLFNPGEFNLPPLSYQLSDVGSSATAATHRGAKTQLYSFDGKPAHVVDKEACHFARTPDGPPITRKTYDRLAHAAVHAWVTEIDSLTILANNAEMMGVAVAFRDNDDHCGDLYVSLVVTN
ncbi:MAG: hypothetical protein AAF698_00135 [Pseudomonadota bacterium]